MPGYPPPFITDHFDIEALKCLERGDDLTMESSVDLGDIAVLCK